MMVSKPVKSALACGVAFGAFALLASAALAQVPASCVKGVDLATLGPTSIVGQGPHGEKAASPEMLKLSDADAEKVRAGHFKVGISMQTVNLDWSQLQVQGITDTLKKYGVSVTGVASAEYQVDKQIADIENTIQQHPDGIISIPVDFTATAPTYKKVSQAGIKLVFMDSIPTGLKHPQEYAAMISADSRGNGQIAAQILASCVAQGGTIGLVNFGVDYSESTLTIHTVLASCGGLTGRYRLHELGDDDTAILINSRMSDTVLRRSRTPDLRGSKR